MYPVALAFTPNYIVPAATCIKSLLDHSSQKVEIICLLTEPLSQKQKTLLERMCGDKAKLGYINIEHGLEGVYVDPKYTIAASFRLLLAKLLPQYDKVLYVDCDMIIRNDMASLYHNTDLDGYVLGAVEEAVLPHQEENMRKIGCDPSHYINSGLLLFNLKLIRELNLTEKFIDALKVDYLEFPDQDVLNLCCAGKIKTLEPKYNSIRTFLIPQYRPIFEKKYSAQQWEELQEHGNIHYTGGKPWNQFTVKFCQWWREYDQLPKEIKSLWKEKFKLRILYSVYNSTIGNAAISFAQNVYRKIKY